MDTIKQTIDILIFENINLLDVAGPAQAFHVANRFSPSSYRLRFISIDGNPITTSCGLKLVADSRASLKSGAQSLVIPGGRGVDTMVGDKKLKQLIQHWLESRPDGRLISICSGALLLANAGVLDGKSATTHWSREHQAKSRYPQVNWCLNSLYMQSCGIFSSAGVTAGIDLAVSIVRSDCGIKIALNVARELVVYLQRAGGQSQYLSLIHI